MPELFWRSTASFARRYCIKSLLHPAAHVSSTSRKLNTIAASDAHPFEHLVLPMPLPAMTPEIIERVSDRIPHWEPHQARSSCSKSRQVPTPPSTQSCGLESRQQESVVLPAEAYCVPEHRGHRSLIATQPTRRSTTSIEQHQLNPSYTLRRYLDTADRVELLSLGLSSTDGSLHGVAYAEELAKFILDRSVTRAPNVQKHEGHLDMSCSARMVVEDADATGIKAAKE